MGNSLSMQLFRNRSRPRRLSRVPNPHRLSLTLRRNPHMSSVVSKAEELFRGDIDALEKALESLKGAKSLEDIKRLIKESSRHLDALQERSRREEERLGKLVQESELQAREITRQANEESRKLVKESEKLRDATLSKLAEVEAREKAVEWVKESEATLKKREQELTKSESEVEKAKSEASAKQAFYTSKLDELTEWEKALTKWEVTVRENGLKNSLRPSPKVDKKVK